VDFDPVLVASAVHFVVSPDTTRKPLPLRGQV